MGNTCAAARKGRESRAGQYLLKRAGMDDFENKGTMSARDRRHAMRRTKPEADREVGRAREVGGWERRERGNGEYVHREPLTLLVLSCLGTGETYNVS